MVRIVFFYIVVFSALTATDIGSTLWATAMGQGQEFNHAVATGDGQLHIERMLMINGGVLLFTVVMLIWALRNRHRIDPKYLEWPERAVFNYFYLNPFSEKIMPKSVLHYSALPLVILFFKAFASINNSLIALDSPDLATPLAMEVVSRTGPGPIAYWIVIFILFHPMWWIALRIVAWALRGDSIPGTADPLAAR